MKLYSIARWGELYENSRSRNILSLDWVAMPNRHDGENYAKIVAHPDGAVIFAGWNLLVQVASKCSPRGVLVKDNGLPHDSSSLSLKTRAPSEWFTKALDYLEINTDWISVTDLSGTYQVPTSNLPLKGREGKGIEEKGTLRGFPREVEFWNANCKELPKVMAMAESRFKKLRSRRQDSFWVANFEQAVVRITKSDFCCGKVSSDRRWKADFDWMLQSDVVAKIMEGKYDNQSRLTKPVGGDF